MQDVVRKGCAGYQETGFFVNWATGLPCIFAEIIIVEIVIWGEVV